MILVDTSVWVDHLRRGSAELGRLLEEGEVVTHPFVIGELACGAVPHRREFLTLLSALPSATVAEHDEVLQFVERHRLYGRGLGWIDVHLLASARLSAAALWTLDRPLQQAAAALRLAP
ncbi:MAG: PIN domain-containing protein [Armatimonadota bacterium]|nr:PIN domain-containing protein [Armatimonadota bacterium]MDR7452674.1 PIN domain-containing protein [Armatimonadota bacterium]MDR7467728.1 PIN domain-containing protein [Armatimonadota bacterium]MDR7499807.1 PIN domain-containing protein [Armatimonadota bacterium]MDR7505247.1 PIN domain-containing protein [Armatimonadota bacterium]